MNIKGFPHFPSSSSAGSQKIEAERREEKDLLPLMQSISTSNSRPPLFPSITSWSCSLLKGSEQNQEQIRTLPSSAPEQKDHNLPLNSSTASLANLFAATTSNSRPPLPKSDSQHSFGLPNRSSASSLNELALGELDDKPWDFFEPEDPYPTHSSSSNPPAPPFVPAFLSPEKIKELNEGTKCSSRTGSPLPRSRIPTPVMHTVQEEKQERDRIAIEDERLLKSYSINGQKIRFSPLEVAGKKAQGANSCVYVIASSTHPLYEGVSNEELVAKMPKQTTKMEVYSDALKQYDDLLKLQNPNFLVKIEPLLNRSTCMEDGFLLQRKVTPFKEAPWIASESLEDMNEKQKSLLEQITRLFTHTLLDTENCGLDLRWENFCEKDDQIVLFDFYELDNEFRVFADSSLRAISGGNPKVAEYILEQSLPLFEAQLEQKIREIESENLPENQSKRKKESLTAIYENCIRRLQDTSKKLENDLINPSKRKKE